MNFSGKPEVKVGNLSEPVNTCHEWPINTKTPPRQIVQIQLRMEPTKPNVLRLYVNSENMARLVKICEVTGLSQAEAISKAAQAALEAIEANGNTFTLPLRLQVTSSAYAQREPSALVLSDKPQKRRKN